MPYVIELFREGAVVGGRLPYGGHLENAKRLALRQARANDANFVRILDGELEIWSERLDTPRHYRRRATR